MADSLVKWVLDLDVSKFTENMKKAGEELKGLADDSKFSGLLGTVESIGKGFVAWEAAKIVSEMTAKVIDATIEMSKLAEEVRAAQKQFDVLAKGAGLSSKGIEDGLKKVADGLVSDTDLANAASKSIVAIGTNAQRLPELFEVARKASAIFGGTATENLEKINLAIESGNTRVLRQMGLWFNATDAIKKYAHEHGLQVEQLSDEAKQQAVLQAILEKSSKSYADINVNQKELSNNLERFKVSLTELKETISIVFDQFFGPALKRSIGMLQEFTRELVDVTKWVFNIGQSAYSTQDKINGITAEIEKLQKKKDSVHGLLFFQRDQDRLDDLKKQLQALQAQKKQIAEEDKKEAEQAPGGIELTKKVDPQEQAKAQAKYYEELSKLNMQYNEERIKSAKTFEDWDDATKAKKVAETEKYNAQLKTMEAANSSNFLISGQQKQAMVEALEREHKQKLLEIDTEYNNEREKKEIEFREKALKTQDTIAAGWKLAVSKQVTDVKIFQKSGEVAFSTLASHAAGAFKAIGAGAKSGSDIMKTFVFGSLGAIAESFGQFYLAKGIADVASGTNPGGPAEIAEGGALMALGGFLSSQGGGDTSVPSSSGGGGGGGSSGGIVSPSSTASIDNSQQSPRKNVTIQVAGPLITDETKTRFLEIMRQATDDTDFKYQQIGVG